MGLTIKKVSELSDEQLKEIGAVIPDKGPGITFTIGDQTITVPAKCIPYEATNHLKRAYQNIRGTSNDATSYDDSDVTTEFLWMIIKANCPQPEDKPFKTLDALKKAADPDQLKDLHTKCYQLMYEPSHLLPKTTQDFLARCAPVRDVINDPHMRILLVQLPAALQAVAGVNDAMNMIVERLSELESWKESTSETASASTSSSTPLSEDVA